MENIVPNKPEETCSNEKVPDSQLEATEQRANDSNIEVKLEVIEEISQIVSGDVDKDKDNTIDQCVSDDFKVQNVTVTCQTVDNDLTKNEDTGMQVSDDVRVQNNTETCQTNELVKEETKGSKYVSLVECLDNEGNTKNIDEIIKTEGDNVEPIIKVQMPLCADYRSDSDSDSVDSESDSPPSSTESSTSSEEDESDDSGTVKSGNFTKNRRLKTDLTLIDLPPIEDLKISMPEDACEEIGIVTSIVDALVVIESYKGTAALDIDTILFLDHGKKTLGRIFEVFGPVTEPVYAVRFNDQDQITNLNIEKGLKVYYAPKTQHTSFVFLSEVMKNRGSDASWKDNIEAPQEFQDFSDDEEERKCRQGNKSEGSHDHNPSRKRPFQKTDQIVQPSRFRGPGTYHQGRFNAPRFSPPSRFRPPHFAPRYAPPNPPPQPFAYIPPYPGENFMNSYPAPPQSFLPPRFSGPPFPTFGVTLYGNLQQPFYQQRTPAFPGTPWRGPVVRPPPPPPPPPSQPFPPSTED